MPTTMHRRIPAQSARAALSEHTRDARYERFRTLTVAWNPEVYHSLPAKTVCELKKRPNFAAIKEQLLASRVAGKRKRWHISGELW